MFQLVQMDSSSIPGVLKGFQRRSREILGFPRGFPGPSIEIQECEGFPAGFRKFQRVPGTFQGRSKDVSMCSSGVQGFPERSMKFKGRSRVIQGSSRGFRGIPRVSKGLKGVSGSIRGFSGALGIFQKRSKGVQGVSGILHGVQGRSFVCQRVSGDFFPKRMPEEISYTSSETLKRPETVLANR